MTRVTTNTMSPRQLILAIFSLRSNDDTELIDIRGAIQLSRWSCYVLNDIRAITWPAARRFPNIGCIMDRRLRHSCTIVCQRLSCLCVGQAYLLWTDIFTDKPRPQQTHMSWLSDFFLGW